MNVYEFVPINIRKICQTVDKIDESTSRNFKLIKETVDKIMFYACRLFELILNNKRDIKKTIYYNFSITNYVKKLIRFKKFLSYSELIEFGYKRWVISKNNDIILLIKNICLYKLFIDKTSKTSWENWELACDKYLFKHNAFYTEIKYNIDFISQYVIDWCNKNNYKYNSNETLFHNINNIINYIKDSFFRVDLETKLKYKDMFTFYIYTICPIIIKDYIMEESYDEIYRYYLHYKKYIRYTQHINKQLNINRKLTICNKYLLSDLVNKFVKPYVKI